MKGRFWSFRMWLAEKIIGRRTVFLYNANILVDGGIYIIPGVRHNIAHTFVGTKEQLNEWRGISQPGKQEGRPVSDDRNLIALGHMGQGNDIFQSIKKEQIDVRIDRAHLGAMGATRVETWSTNDGRTVEAHMSNGGFSLYEVREGDAIPKDDSYDG